MEKKQKLIWMYQEILGLKGISLEEKVLLADIYDHACRGVPYRKTRREAGEWISARPPVVTRKFSHLEKAGYIRRFAVTGDREWDFCWQNDLTPFFYEKTGLPVPDAEKN